MAKQYKCPKCGGSDYFMSQRNVVKGMGWAQRGSLKSIPVCRACDEIMEGAVIGMPSWEDVARGSGANGVQKRKMLLLMFIPFFILIMIGYVFVQPTIVLSATVMYFAWAVFILLRRK